MKYIVKHGPEGDMSGISTITDNRDYAEGFAAGMNHASKSAWRYIEEVKPIPGGTPVRFWPGSREGRSVTSVIRKGGHLILIGGTPCQFVEDYTGGVAVTHIEVIEEES